MEYRRCGKSGLLLPMITLGLWHNFGTNDSYDNMIEMLCTAFDNGISSFDLANNYGPTPGAAEENFGKILKSHFHSHRDAIVITSKAGHTMWDGPYGDWGSRKHIIASINQSLKRLNVDYVDIFYTHRPDPNTPLEETMQALADIVNSGKALYIGLSKYPKDLFEKAVGILKQLGRIPIIYQGRSSILDQSVFPEILPSVSKNDCGFAAFSPLAQGLLSNKYLNGIPSDSRAASKSQFLNPNEITEHKVSILKELDTIAKKRGQSLAQMSISYLLNDERITTVVTGASKTSQIIDTIKSIENISFTKEELNLINTLSHKTF